MAIYYNSKPVDIDTTFDPTSENAVSGIAVKEAIDEAVQSMYKPGGSILFSNLPVLSVDVLGFVYNITDAFTTDARFIEGAGTECAAGTNVVVVNTGTEQNPVYKFDILAAGAVQVQSDWSQSDTSAVDYIKNKPTIQTVTAGTGIDITNNTISVTSPTLSNTAENSTSLSINGISSSNTIDQSINIGSGSECLYNRSIAIGYNAKANPGRDGQGSVAIGRHAQANGPRSLCIGNGAKTTGIGTIVLGDRGSTTPSADYKFYVGNHDPDLWELLDLTTGLIPEDRLPSTAPSIDNTTITKNASDELQASAVMNARTGTDAMPIWQGTEQEWTNGVGTDWYNWRTDVSISGSSNIGNLQTGSYSPDKILFGNNVYICPMNYYLYTGSTDSYKYSTDGINWVTKTLPGTAQSISFGNGVFFAAKANSSIIYTSIDGENWNIIDLGNSISDNCVSCKYVNGICYITSTSIGGNWFYSTDGITWNYISGSLRGTEAFYGNNEYVMYIGGSGQSTVYKSTDGLNWTSINLNNGNLNFNYMAYGNGIYVLKKYASNEFYTSTDLTNWTSIGSVGTSNSNRITFEDGLFLSADSYSNGIETIIYSSDGINWGSLTNAQSSSIYTCRVVNGSLYLLGGTTCFKAVLGQSSAYTLEAEPTTASTVYSAPNTTSALTITSIGTGTITLSDNNTYTYTSSGDVTTYQTIGDAYPNYLANINGVGVKIGNTLIADNTDTSGLQPLLTAGTGIDITNGVISETDQVEIVNFTRDLTDTSILKIVPSTSGYAFPKDKIYVMSFSLKQNPVGGEPTPIDDNTSITMQDGTGRTINFMISGYQATTFKDIKALLRPKVNQNNKKTTYYGYIIGTLNGVGSAPYNMAFNVFSANNDPVDMQTTTNLVTSVSSSSTDTQYPSAKLFYDTCGDIETLINAL